jgi:Xaa-Pro aminopeptidase
MFSKDTYMNKRQRLKKKVKSGVILILGNEESSMNYADNTYHFRQDSSFLYLFGLDYPGLAGVIDIDEDKDFIFGNDLTIEDIIWMGMQPSIKERSLRVGVENTGSLSDLKAFLKQAKQKNRKIHFLPPYRPENKIKLLELLDISPLDIAGAESTELIKAVVDQRSFKSEEEIVEIEKAVNVSADMHIAAMKMAKPGMYEAEIAGMIEGMAISSGGRLSFPAILTIHGETLHNHYHGNILEEGQMVLNDSGAETAKRYAGDISRTFPVGKKFTARQKEIYSIALKAHENAISSLKPGVPFKDIHLMACKTIAEGLKEMGFMKGDMDEAVAQGAHALFFQCGTGHMMGLDVHDMEDLGEVYVGYDGKPKSTQFGLKSLRLARELKPGFVVTVEPGIYFIPQLIDRWKAGKKFIDFINYDKVEEYKDFGGLRNEDDIVITEDGYRVLGKPIPKTIEDVESMRS